MEWLKNPDKWNKRSLVEKLELLRKHYCTGPCGQSNSVLTTREETNKVFKEVINLLTMDKPSLTVDGRCTHSSRRI